MNMKRFQEKNMHTALQKIREELGDNAVIISSSQSSTGVEVVAATDYEAVANSDYVSSVETYEKPEKHVEKVEKDESVNFQSQIQEIDTSAIQEEINQLRGIIESQTELISWNKLINQNTVARRLLQKLSISGFGFNLSKKLLDKVKHIEDFDDAFIQIENYLRR